MLNSFSVINAIIIQRPPSSLGHTAIEKNDLIEDVKQSKKPDALTKVMTKYTTR